MSDPDHRGGPSPGPSSAWSPARRPGAATARSWPARWARSRRLGARLARLTFSPDLLLTDGEALLIGDVPRRRTSSVTEGWLPYRRHLTMVAGGSRHVMMGASQLDRYGNQNISCIGDWERPEAPAPRRARRARSTPSTTRSATGCPGTRPGSSSSRSTWSAASATTARRRPGPSATRFHELRRGRHRSRRPRLRGRRTARCGCARVHPGVTVDAGARGHRIRAGRAGRRAAHPRADRRGTAADPRGAGPAGPARPRGRGRGGPPRRTRARAARRPLQATPLTRLVGVRHPIVQTGMGWVAGPRLVVGDRRARARSASSPRRR